VGILRPTSRGEIEPVEIKGASAESDSYKETGYAGKGGPLRSEGRTSSGGKSPVAGLEEKGRGRLRGALRSVGVFGGRGPCLKGLLRSEEGGVPSLARDRKLPSEK